MEKELNVNELVKIETMPQIYYKLEQVGLLIDESLKDIDILDCTEENKQEVKRRRTEINNITKQFEDKRKDIKKKILEPYEMFNDKYEQEIKGKLLSASEILKSKIDVIEEEQKAKKLEELQRFAIEYIQSFNLNNILNYADLGITVTLSASEKSLKEKIKERVEQITKEIELINSEEYSDEVLLEYQKNGYNYIWAKSEVINRHKQLEEIAKTKEHQTEQLKQEEQVVEKVEEIIMPAEEEKIEVSFTVKGTKEQIRDIVTYMKANGIDYE